MKGSAKDSDRFDVALRGILDKRLTYKVLTAKQDDYLPAAIN
jgi:hypothetical protein